MQSAATRWLTVTAISGPMAPPQSMTPSSFIWAAFFILFTEVLDGGRTGEETRPYFLGMAHSCAMRTFNGVILNANSSADDGLSRHLEVAVKIPRAAFAGPAVYWMWFFGEAPPARNPDAR